MAKSKGFFGLRTGSTKSMTFSVLRGQQITKDRVEGGANPRTYSQMIQRMLFANAVKFYKHARAGFFKFAYEDKKPLESDYNAFMRNNSTNAVSVGRAEYNIDAFPALGRFLLSKGSLPIASTQWDNDNDAVELDVASSTNVTTIGHLSQRILDKYVGLQVGDICTIVVVNTLLNTESELEGTTPPSWDIRQFVLDPADTRNCLNTIFVQMQSGANPALIKDKNGDALTDDYARGCAVIFSRNTPSGLKVSDGYLKPNSVATTYIVEYEKEGTIKAMASTWGAADPAILQGALAE